MNIVRKALMPAVLASVATLGIAEFGNAADQTSANADLLKKYIAAFNQHDPEAFKAVIAENYLQHNGRAGQGLSGLQATARQYFQTFPDFNMALADSIITNDKVVARVEITATHDHPVQLGPNAPVFLPTGKKLSWQGISIWRVSGGKFVEHWDVDDLLSLAQQMRATPPRN
jgi:predicted ester cyclase